MESEKDLNLALDARITPKAEVPSKAKVTNTYHHDLESLFYVLIWICTIFSRPGVIRPASELSEIVTMTWNEEKSVREIGDRKYANLRAGGKHVLAGFSSYFTSFSQLF